ncbi:MAG: transglutaminase domain-containing protein [Bacteroidales bacterium]|nr:transglutaminase domain-containing protein [Bacteroidales bacterium]
MKAKILFFLLGFLISGCTNFEYTTEEVDNPVYHPNTQFFSYEDLSSPKFGHLIEKYRLDTIFHGETDEFKRILLLRHWIKTVIKINDFGDPYPGDGYAEQILDNALRGQGYHCGHFMTVQNALMNAFGYVTRTLGAGPGGMDGSDGHHGINEIWLNSYNKWFLSDAKYDHHFEKDGVPLSALEIRDEYLKNKAADIVKVKGPDRIPFDIDAETGYSREENARTYTWIEWHGYNNIFTVWPEYKDLLIMYRDDFFRNNTWIWGGKPHWAYAQPEFMKPVDERTEIYWTPNTISSEVLIEGKVATVKLKSDTPNLKEYQVRQKPSTAWEKVDSAYVVNLKKKNHELVFRALNLAGVAGPEHRVIIKRKTR